MSINRNLLIIIEPNHPHFELIKSIYEIKNISEALSSYQTYDLVIDLTILSTKRKLTFLKELTRTTRAKIISDLTCCFQERILNSQPQVIASISSFFYSPTKSFEFFISNKENNSEVDLARNVINIFFNKLGFNTIETSVLEFTFIMPRVLSQIINEAYFALEENLATKNDIDLAMINGVNYPEGPLLWGKKSGLKNILTILEEQFKYTKDNRYRPSMHLIKATLLKDQNQ